MIEITDEMYFAAIHAFAEKRKGDKSAYNGPDWLAMCAALAAVAPLIEAQVRQASDEDRMAGEILRAMMADDDVITLQNAGIGVGFVVSAMDENRQIGCNHKGRYATIPALHAAMVEAGMIGGGE